MIPQVLMPRCRTVLRGGGQPVCQRILEFDPSGTYEGHFSRTVDQFSGSGQRANRLSVIAPQVAVHLLDGSVVDEQVAAG